ncbi:MAG: hypothetical protein LBO62_05850 [Endomicrobium sp.]|jgi:hypothetical protein|nr:hypothetical protein [Endomicrobium sp.]
MGKIKTISAIVAFIFTIPLVLAHFIYIKPIWGVEYFFLYLVLFVYFIILSAFLLILILIFNNNFLKKLYAVTKTVMLVLIAMFLINCAIVLLTNEKEFITGANYYKFNGEKWQKADFYNSNLRKYMLKDLVKNVLPNKNIEEVISILGDPYSAASENKTYYLYSIDGNLVFQEVDIDENGKIIRSDFIDKKQLYQSGITSINYITGPNFIDCETLIISFDENGIFRKYEIGSS